MLNCEDNTNRKLFIIGNGFDRDHSLPTDYKDFKKYLSDLIKEYEGIDKSQEFIEILEIPKSTIPNIITRNGTLADYPQERKIVYWLIDDVAKRKHDIKWSDFENYLGQLRSDKVVKKWGNDMFEMQCLRDAINDIRGFFFEWINTIDLNIAQRKEPYASLINTKKDIALSFNYTETLEYVYGMDAANICYIHGQRETDPVLRQEKRMLPFGKNNSHLVVGFGAQHVRTDRAADKKDLLMGLYKNTKSIIYQHREFFNKISSAEINEIYSIGFSYAEVDLPYIKKICHILRQDNRDRNMTWFISPYGSTLKKIKEEVHFRRCIRRAGFRGRICKL